MSISTRAVLVKTLIAVGATLSLGQNEVLPTVDEILEIARSVNERYPWVLLNERGLTLTAIDLDREEFLRGISAAMEIVFSGTEELPESISLIVHSARADTVLEEIERLDPFLTYRADWDRGEVVLRRIENPTDGLTDEDLIARYRRIRPSPNTIRSDRGAFVPGALVSEGARFPIPLNVEILPSPAEGKVFLRCNNIILKEFPYRNPVEIDVALHQATTKDEWRNAMKNKLDRMYHEISRFPFSSTGELLGRIAQGASFLPFVSKAGVSGGKIRIRRPDETDLEWTPPAPTDSVLLSEPEAIHAAYEFQNKLNFDLSRGSVVLLSEQYGDTAIENGFQFFRRLDEISSNEKWTLAEKELEIRKTWEEKADQVLEYFYTSVVTNLENDSWPRYAARQVEGSTQGFGATLIHQKPLLDPPFSPAPLIPKPSPPVPPPPVSVLPLQPIEPRTADPDDGLGLESLVDPKAEAAEELFSVKE